MHKVAPAASVAPAGHLKGAGWGRRRPGRRLGRDRKCRGPGLEGRRRSWRSVGYGCYYAVARVGVTGIVIVVKRRVGGPASAPATDQLAPPVRRKILTKKVCVEGQV